MKKKFYILFITVLSFCFISSVNAEIIGGYDTSNYFRVYSVNSSYITKHLDKLSVDNLNYINNYFNENYGNSENKYVLYGTILNNNTIDLSLVDFTNPFYSDNMFFGTVLTTYNKDVKTCFRYSFSNNNILSVECSNFTYLNTYADSSGGHFVFWSNNDYHFSDLPFPYGPNYTSFGYMLNYDTGFKEKYGQYYDYEVLTEKNLYIYTLMDIFGINASKPSNIALNVKYKINYYFDDILNINYTEEKIGQIGDVITEFTDYSNEQYKLINNDYKLALLHNEEENILNIYYETIKYSNYKIEFYFNDIINDKYTIIDTGQVGSELTEFPDYSNAEWSLEDTEYKFLINEDSNLNIFKIYYYNSLYGTEYQDIDTKNSKIPFIFNYSDIKEAFPSIAFKNFTQFEQLLITILLNVLFMLFVGFVVYTSLKMLYKIFQFL